METFSALLALCEGNPPLGHWRGALTFSLIYAWKNGWANNRAAGELRHHRAHYDVTVMELRGVHDIDLRFMLQHKSFSNKLVCAHTFEGHPERSPCWLQILHMMTSSNGNIFRVTDHLCGEFPVHREIPRTKASDAELWYFLWSAPE